jgi:hypothetical protein
MSQYSTKPEELETVMLKARTTLNVNMFHIRQVCCNTYIRALWETILYDVQGFDITADMNSMKTYYVYKCPRIGFIGIEDRDFVLS